MSINTQQGISMSRRDDIESLSYVAIFLAKGSLPWSQVNLQDKAKMYQDALFLKKRFNQYELCRELPPVFLEFLKYARQMEFSQKPDYNLWIKKFIAASNNPPTGHHSWSTAQSYSLAQRRRTSFSSEETYSSAGFSKQPV
jgi:hypothetical protein